MKAIDKSLTSQKDNKRTPANNWLLSDKMFLNVQQIIKGKEESQLFRNTGVPLPTRSDFTREDCVSCITHYGFQPENIVTL